MNEMQIPGKRPARDAITHGRASTMTDNRIADRIASVP
jgi:hypothetical protein